MERLQCAECPCPLHLLRKCRECAPQAQDHHLPLVGGKPVQPAENKAARSAFNVIHGCCFGYFLVLIKPCCPTSTGASSKSPTASSIPIPMRAPASSCASTEVPQPPRDRVSFSSSATPHRFALLVILVFVPITRRPFTLPTIEGRQSGHTPQRAIDMTLRRDQDRVGHSVRQNWNKIPNHEGDQLSGVIVDVLSPSGLAAMWHPASSELLGLAFPSFAALACRLRT